MRLTIKQRRTLGLIRFFTIFSLCSIPVYLINWLNINFYLIESFQAGTVSLMLNLFSVPHQVTETVDYNTGQTIPLIIAGTELFGIGRECTGFVPIMAFIGLVIASPKRNKQKSLIFVPVIFLTNLLRTFFLAIAGVNYPSIVPLLHDLLWGFGMVLAVFSCWAYWFKHV